MNKYISVSDLYLHIVSPDAQYKSPNYKLVRMRTGYRRDSRL